MNQQEPTQPAPHVNFFLLGGIFPDAEMIECTPPTSASGAVMVTVTLWFNTSEGYEVRKIDMPFAP